MKFVIATHNENKILEFLRILEPMGMEIVRPQIIEAEENGKTFEENAYIKAKSACDETSLPAIADDSGLCIDILNGEPGIYSARYAEAGKRKQTILKKMLGADNRAAQFVCAISCVFPNGDVISVEEVCEGEISKEIRGEGGFGYDPIFLVGDKTFAELTGEEKDKLSHRGKALRKFNIKLREYLKEYPIERE